MLWRPWIQLETRRLGRVDHSRTPDKAVFNSVLAPYATAQATDGDTVAACTADVCDGGVAAARLEGDTVVVVGDNRAVDGHMRRLANVPTVSIVRNIGAGADGVQSDIRVRDVTRAASDGVKDIWGTFEMEIRYLHIP